MSNATAPAVADVLTLLLPVDEVYKLFAFCGALYYGGVLFDLLGCPALVGEIVVGMVLVVVADDIDDVVIVVADVDDDVEVVVAVLAVVVVCVVVDVAVVVVVGATQEAELL